MKRPKVSERLHDLLKAHPALVGYEVSVPQAAQGYWRQHSRGGDYRWSARIWPKGEPDKASFVDAIDTMTDCVRQGVLLDSNHGLGFIASRIPRPRPACSLASPQSTP